eukprot:gene17794-biopygen13704
MGGEPAVGGRRAAPAPPRGLGANGGRRRRRERGNKRPRQSAEAAPEHRSQPAEGGGALFMCGHPPNLCLGRGILPLQNHPSLVAKMRDCQVDFLTTLPNMGLPPANMGLPPANMGLPPVYREDELEFDPLVKSFPNAVSPGNCEGCMQKRWKRLRRSAPIGLGNDSFIGSPDTMAHRGRPELPLGVVSAIVQRAVWGSSPGSWNRKSKLKNIRAKVAKLVALVAEHYDGDEEHITRQHGSPTRQHGAPTRQHGSPTRQHGRNWRAGAKVVFCTCELTPASSFFWPECRPGDWGAK